MITLNYITPVSGTLKSKIERSVKILEDVIRSKQFWNDGRFTTEKEQFFQFIQHFTVYVKIDESTNPRHPASYYPKDKRMTLATVRVMKYSDEKLAGLIAHEIGHQWFDHGRAEFGGFMYYLQADIPIIARKMKPNWFQKAWINIKTFFKQLFG